MENNSSSPKKAKILLLLTGSLLIIGTALFIYWYLWGRFTEFTDDAYVSGNLVYVTPQVTGIVTDIYIDDTDYVVEGTPLVDLDRTDFLIALEKSKAELADKVRSVAQLFTTAQELEAKIEIKKAAFIQSAQDFERRLKLVDRGSVSKEDFDHAEKTLSASYYALVAAEEAFFTLFAQIENTTVSTHPWVELAKQKVKDAWIHLKRCTLYAPVTGLVAKKTVQVGERIDAASPVLAVVPLDQIWVDANFKEVQIGKMQIGQKADITADIYGNGVKYQGTIIGIAGGTGSVFSLLPPQNATGNWIKIVQRLPIRIALNPLEIAEHPLRLGLSAEVRVDIHNIGGSVIPSLRENKTLYHTDVFASEEAGVEEIIAQIIRENTPSFFEQAEIQ